MTADAAEKHWREGGERALLAAEHLMESGDFEMALFSCELAVEKTLKALCIAVKKHEPPKSHNLEWLCRETGKDISEQDRLDLRELSSFVAFTCYGDETWLDAEATKENTKHWLERTQYFLSLFTSCNVPTTNDGLQIARELKALIRSHVPALPLRRVVLFGSVARGQARESSAIDIAVICDLFDRSKVKEVRQMYALSPELNARVELVVLHPEDLKNSFLTIARTVQQEGIEV